MENYCQANKEIWDLGINRRARKPGGNLGQGKGRERKAPTTGGGENNPGGPARGKGASVLVGGTPNLGFRSVGVKHSSRPGGPGLHPPDPAFGEGLGILGAKGINLSLGLFGLMALCEWQACKAGSVEGNEKCARA